MPRLNVGCGLRPLDGWVNLDKFKLPGVDVVFDLDQLGITKNVADETQVNADLCRKRFEYVVFLPYPDDYFDEVRAEDVLEHVEDMVTVVQELGRVLKVGG